MPRENMEQAATEERSVEDREYVRNVFERKDEVALGELLRTMRREAFAYAHQRIGTFEGADDVLQQADINVLKGLREESFDTSKAFRSWYYAIITNAGIDFQRRNKRYSNMLRLDSTIEDVSAEMGSVKVSNLLESKEVDPAISFLLQRQRSDVRAKVARLSLQKQDLYHRVFVRGQQYSEIAEDLNIPLGTVKSRISKLKDEFRAMYNNEEVEMMLRVA